MRRKRLGQGPVIRGADLKDKILDQFTRRLIDFQQRKNNPEAKKLTLDDLWYIHKLFRELSHDAFYLRAPRHKELNREPILGVFYQVCEETFRRECRSFHECIDVLRNPEMDKERGKQINKAYYRLSQLTKVYIDMRHAEKIMTEGNQFLNGENNPDAYPKHIMFSVLRVAGLGWAEKEKIGWRILGLVDDQARLPAREVKTFKNNIRTHGLKSWKIRRFMERSKIFNDGAFTEIFVPSESPINDKTFRPPHRKKLSSRELAYLYSGAVADIVP